MSRPTLLVLFLLLTSCGPIAYGKPDAGPMVAGFERFSRHDTIETAAAGRLLIAELSCTACHKTAAKDLQPKLGPKLEGVAVRVDHDWLAKFLASPQAMKPGTTMPDVLASFSGAEKAKVIEALTAFLSAQQEPFPVIKATGVVPVPEKFWNLGNKKNGQQLYHQVGCVACHEPDPDQETVTTEPTPLDRMLEDLDPEELAELGLDAAARPVSSVPHGDLVAKYSRKSLTYFLLNPEKVRPGGRMPSLKLSPVEASDIAAYLLRKQVNDSAARTSSDNPSLVKEGKHLFSSLGCANCHSATGVEPALQAKPLSELRAVEELSCWGTPTKGLPHFVLDELQTEAIAAALAEPNNDDPLSAEQAITSQMLRLNCYACHQRDGQGGVGRNRKAYFETVRHIDIGDEGRLPPLLNGVGRKLKTSWLKKVFEGSGDVRSHLIARMPKYPATAVAQLPELFAQADIGPPQTEKEVFGEYQSLVKEGRTLLDTGCVQCHPVRGESLPGVVGIDLEGIATRLQPSWFHEFLLDPGKLKPRTRMPTFFPEGRGQDKSVLDGDANLQIAALWGYLRDVGKQPLPEKIEQARSQDLELIPKQRPILLRTFMREAGTHAIAVGFPQGVHYAFDADGVRFAQSWRGKFLDAQGTWFERFTPPADPLGKDLINLPAGVPFALLENQDQAWPADSIEAVDYKFLGYRLDAAGIPTLLYRFKNFEIEDRIIPGKGRTLQRSIAIKAQTRAAGQESLWFRANVGKRLTPTTESSYTSDNGLTVQVSQPTGQQGVLRTIENMVEWLVPIDNSAITTIQVEYQW